MSQHISQQQPEQKLSTRQAESLPEEFGSIIGSLIGRYWWVLLIVFGIYALNQPERQLTGAEIRQNAAIVRQWCGDNPTPDCTNRIMNSD